MSRSARLVFVLLLGLLLACRPLGPTAVESGPRPQQTYTLYLPLTPSVTGMPQIAGCPILPADNVWNHPVDALPVHPLSDAYVASIGAEEHVHADFGSGEWPPGSGSPIGIPYVVVPGAQLRRHLSSQVSCHALGDVRWLSIRIPHTRIPLSASKLRSLERHR